MSEGKATAAPEKTALNSQALEAAKTLRELVAKNPNELAKAGLSLALSQSAAIALQDATDHMRRMQILSEAGVARAMAQEDPAKAQALVEAATQAAASASEVLAKTGEVARSLLD